MLHAGPAMKRRGRLLAPVRPCRTLKLADTRSRRVGEERALGVTRTHPPHAAAKREMRFKKMVADQDEIQTVDLDVYRASAGGDAAAAAECAKAAQSLHRTGCLYVRDSRVAEADNEAFLDLLERYFAASDGKRDARPELHYQVGVTPAMIERPRDHCARARAFEAGSRPLTLCPPEADPKWRYFWRIGPLPPASKFPQLNHEAVVPPDFPEWRAVMDMWGEKMLDAVTGVAALAAEGFGLPADAFTSRMQYGPHLLAPTGSDFGRHGQLGTVLAGFHYDLNFLTIHGRSRFPGLYIWLRNGQRVPVRVPEGCLLVQAGKQMEYLTGGHVLAGFHEVVVAPETLEAIERRKARGQSLWRVSSTLFSHIASDQVLRPLDGPWASSSSASSAAAGAQEEEEGDGQGNTKDRYPPILAGDQVMEELRAIKLGQQ